MEETDDSEILHCRKMGKGTKPNGQDTPAKVGVQLISHHIDDIDFQLQYGGTYL